MTKIIFNREPIFDVAQGIDEQIVHGFITTNWGTAPTSVAVVAKTLPDLVDVTATVFPTNSPSVSGDTITLSLLKSLTEGTTYRIEVKFTVDEGSIFELFGIVRAKL